jgi:carbonic anhydrase
MDNRKHLHIPDNFAYIIRSGGANLRYSEFKVSYAISAGGIKHIALIGHNNCGMVNLNSRKDQFVYGLEQNAGWTKKKHWNTLCTLLLFLKLEMKWISC